MRVARGELLTLTLESIQQREDHWVIADLVGKGRHVRTVPIPIIDAGEVSYKGSVNHEQATKGF
jgi:hypothetical protein